MPLRASAQAGERSIRTPPPPPSPPSPPCAMQVSLSESLLSTLDDGVQQRKATSANWMRELRRMGRELGGISASMKTQAMLLPMPSGEETLFDFVNEEEIKVCPPLCSTRIEPGTGLIHTIGMHEQRAHCIQCEHVTGHRMRLRLLSARWCDSSRWRAATAPRSRCCPTTSTPASRCAGTCLAVTVLLLPSF